MRMAIGVIADQISLLDRVDNILPILLHQIAYAEKYGWYFICDQKIEIAPKVSRGAVIDGKVDLLRHNLFIRLPRLYPWFFLIEKF